MLTRRQLQGPTWRRLLRDVYADARLPVDHGLFIAAAQLVIPPGVAIAGRSAAWLRGADQLIDAVDPVQVLVRRAERFGPVAGLRIVTANDVPTTDVESDRGVLLTTPGRTATDVARWSKDLVEAVVALDAMLAAGAVRPNQLAAAVAALSVGHRHHTAMRAASLSDGRSESPQETRLRVRLVLAGLPAPVPQFEVRHLGRFLARVDLAYPARKLAIEYDGAWHAAPGQLARDRQRLNRLVGAGWRVIHVTATDLYDDRIIGTIRTALLAGGMSGESTSARTGTR